MLASLRRLHASAAGRRKDARSVSGYVEAKTKENEAAMDYLERLKVSLQEVHQSGYILKSQFREAVREVDNDIYLAMQELVVLKRMTKIVIGDLAEEAPHRLTFDEAYSSVITSKVMNPYAEQKEHIYDRMNFEENALSYYDATKSIVDNESGTARRKSYCHLTGWHKEKLVKAAHIVPKSLESDEIAYLFGVHQVVLSDPRNSLTLHANIKKALDSGLIVFVPVRSTWEEVGRWRCIVTDRTKIDNEVLTGVVWRDMHCKELKFLTPHRPASRFLYFRFLITFLHCQKDDNTGWVLRTRVDGEQRVWASRGAHLRQSTLLAVARKISDYPLSKDFYQHNTFKITDGYDFREEAEEEDIVLSLALRLINEKKSADTVLDEEESKDDDDDDDEK